MALVDNRKQRILMLCGLYVAQGVPWGFMLITLPAYLIADYGVGDAEIGKLTAIILVPWSFKLIWAPLMDSFTYRPMGRRRPWIIGAELMMAISLLGFIGLGDPSKNLEYILVMYFVHNCFASLQDVCTDALAIDILPVSEQGKMNGLMWGSKLVGKGLGATVLAYVLKWGGIEACVAVQIAILLAIMLIPMFILERPGEKRFPWSTGQATTDEEPSSKKPDKIFDRFDFDENILKPLIRVVKALIRAFSLTTLLIFIVFTLCKLVGSGINEIVTKTLLGNHVTDKWASEEISTAYGVYSLAPIIVAALLGGFLADRYGRRTILLIGFGGYGLVALVFAAFPNMWHEDWFAMSYIISTETLNAIASVGFLSMAMRISWTTSAATVFTTYMTLSNVSHLVGNWLAGPVREFFLFGEKSQSAELASYEMTFWLVGFITILPLALLVLVRPPEVDRAREAEAAENSEV